MHMFRNLLTIVVLTCSFSLNAGETDPMALGQMYTEKFYNGDTESIWANMTSKMRSSGEENMKIPKIFAGKGKTHSRCRI